MNAHKDLLARSSKHSRKDSKPSDEKPHVAELHYTGVTNTPGELMGVAVWFQKFLHRGDGYLKVKRELDSSTVHFTWTWVIGPYQRSYVYVRTEYYQAGYALELLEQKILDVESGLSHPTPDRYVK